MPLALFRRVPNQQDALTVKLALLHLRNYLDLAPRLVRIVKRGGTLPIEKEVLAPDANLGLSVQRVQAVYPAHPVQRVNFKMSLERLNAKSALLVPNKLVSARKLVRAAQVENTRMKLDKQLAYLASQATIVMRVQRK